MNSTAAGSRPQTGTNTGVNSSQNNGTGVGTGVGPGAAGVVYKLRGRLRSSTLRQLPGFMIRTEVGGGADETTERWVERGFLISLFFT